MLTPRGALAVAVVDGRIHAIGGNAKGARDLPPHQHGAPRSDGSVATHEVYDPATNTWTRLAPMPTPRNHLGAAVVAHRGLVYVFGGETVRTLRSKTFHEVERFDPATGRWQRLPPMPTARHGLGAASSGDGIHVLGGGPRPGMAFSAANERLVELP